MGTITKIRQISPYVFVVFAVLFVTFMVLSDNISNLAGSGGESPSTAAICKINGEKVYYKDYEERVKTRIEQMRNDPQNEGKEIDEQSVRNQVWDEMLREVLIKQAGERLGIIVTDDEILDILIENPPDYLKSSFTDTAGVFNRQLYLDIITNPEILVNYIGGQNKDQMTPEMKAKYVSDFRHQLIVITDYLRLQKVTDAMTNTINAAYAVSSPAYVEKKFIDDNSAADINYIYLGVNSIPDTVVNVSDSEIKNYYEKNKSTFKVKNERKVKSMMFPISPSADDTARVTKRVEKIKEELAAVITNEQKDSLFSVKINEYTGVENDWELIQNIPPQISTLFANSALRDVIGPLQMPDGVYFYRLDGKRSGEQEVVKASHILISFNNNKDSAKAFAQKIMKEANSKNFAELAMKHSEDKGSGAQGGDLGYFGKGRMVPEFEQAAFGAKVGSIVGPVESQFGYHIIKVDDKRSEELKYSYIAFKPTISNATKNKIKRDAFAAMKQIEEGANIDTIAKKLNLQCSESPFITKDRPFQGSMFLTNKIFEAKVNDVMEPKEIYNGAAIVVAQVSNIRKAGIGSLEDETENIKTKLIKIKKLDLLKKKSEEIYNLVRGNSTLEGITELPEGLTVANANIKNNGAIPGLPADYAATTHAFKLPTNKINEPIRCDYGYFIFEIKSREIPTAEKAKKEAQDVTKAQYTRNLFENWFNKFKEDSDIKDYRSKYFTEF